MLRPGSGRRKNLNIMSQEDIKLRTISQKTQYRLRQIAKMTLDQIPDSEIALLFGYSNVCSISNLRATPEYKLIYAGLTNAQTISLELEATNSTKELRKAIQCRIPEALRVYYDALEDKKADIRLKAADKIIELDGRLGKKISENNVSQFFFSDKDLSIGDRIVESLKTAGGPAKK